MKRLYRRIILSIPVRICISILLIETVLLGLMGFFYTRNFDNEIDTGLLEKIQLPATLMSLRALNFSAVTNFEAISDFIQEEVVDAFIIKANGTIYYTPDPNKDGKNYRSLLSPEEMSLPELAINRTEHIRFKEPDGDNFISTLAPLTVNNRFLGNLYIKISSNRSEQKKRDILLLFVSGSILTIMLTTILEAFYLYNMIVPRIAKTTKVLNKVEKGDFSAQVISSESPDELGRLIEQVNGMIHTVARRTKTLKQINAAGEQLTQIQTHKQLSDTSSALLKECFEVTQFKTLPFSSSQGSDKVKKQHPHLPPVSVTRDKKQIILTLPSNPEHKDFIQTIYTCKDRSPIAETNNKLLLQSLNRMLSNTLKRVDTMEQIRKAEVKYRKLFSSTVDGIFKTTPEGQILDINPALASLMGYESTEEMRKCLSDLRTKGYAVPQDRDKVQQLLKEHGFLKDYELDIKKKDGSIIPVSVSMQTVKDSSGEIIAYEGRVINIEDRKLRERAERKREIAETARQIQENLVTELEMNRHQLQKSVEEKEILLRELLHRTKNNMLVIISMLHLQIQSLKDPKMISIFKDTENRIRAMALVHEKLHRSENLAEINLGDYLKEMVDTLVNSMVLDKRITVNINAESVSISIDSAVPLGLAVNEIITNAIIHGFPGDRKGAVSITVKQNKAKVIELTICDDGVGLPKNFDFNDLTSFGTQMTRALITQQLQGSYSLYTEKDTVAKIRFTEPQRLQRVSF